MGEIHKIIKDGVVIYPATTTDAVVHPQLKKVISDTITEYNITLLFPNSGSNNGNTYTLQSAISLLEEKLLATQKVRGIKVIFIDKDSSEIQEWRYIGNYFTDPSSWSREDSWYEDLQEEIEDLENNIINDALRKSEQLLSLTEKEQVKSNLDLQINAYKIVWSEDKNLNDYLTSGIYTITGYRINSEDNMPIPDSENNVGISGILVVNSISLYVVGQTLTLYDNISKKIRVYCREFNEEGWSNWRKLLDSVDIADYYTKDEVNEVVENMSDNFASTSDVLKIKNEVFPLQIRLSITPDPEELQIYTGANKTFLVSWEAITDSTVNPSEVTAISLKVNGTEYPVDLQETYQEVDVNNDAVVELTMTARELTATKTANIRFTYPAYTGVVEDNFVISESNITNLTEMDLVDGRSRSYTYPAYNNKKIIYAYASDYGDLTKIIVEPANTDFIHLFNKQTVTINNITYNVYIYSNVGSTEGDLTYIYK